VASFLHSAAIRAGATRGRRELDAPSTRLAVAGCWRCPAREACLAYAVAADEREGVWGATLPEERRELRRDAA
jgi:hypothetical protein